MAGFTTFSIEVSKSAAEGWTAISSSTNPFTNYERSPGVAVNTNPDSPYFGTIYVNNARDLQTASLRPMGEGIYSLTADMIGVDLANNFAVVTDANDASLAKRVGWSADPAGTVNPWRMVIDANDNLIISDWSDNLGGIKYMSPNLTSGGLVLDEEGGPTGGVFSSVSDEFGPIPLHGSIASKPIITGSVGNNLTLWALDEDLDKDLEHPGGDGNSVWRWDVGNATNYDINPKLVINGAAIPNTSDNRSNWLALNVGVLSEAHYDPVRNKFYLAQNRDDGNQAGLIVVTPDGVDGQTPTLEWSSLQFSIDNNLDGHSGIPAAPTGTSTDLQDVFRNIGGNMTVSPDGTKLFVHRVNHTATNPVLGPASNVPGAVLVIPLDENGIPDLEVSGGMITNMDSITTASNTNNASARGLALDAAGNVYTTNNNSERLQVFSPGGSWKAVTNSDGTFSLDPLATLPGTAGDYNNDGIVNAADYVVWRKFLGTNTQLENEGEGVTPGMVTAEDYATWRTNFGMVTPPGAGSAAAAVPEPGAIVLAMIALAMFGARRMK
jgi:hypothetical protein